MEKIIACPYCGATNAPGNMICDYCGTALTKGQPGESKPDLELAVALPPAFSGLKRPKPANISLAGIGTLIFGIPWTIFSVIFLVLVLGVSIREQKLFDRLKIEGLTAQAVITNLEVEDSDDSTSYYVDYRFTVPFNGEVQTYEHYASVSQSVYQPLETGGRVEILYAASDPGVSTVKAQFGPPNLLAPIIGGGMSLLFTGIGLAMIISGFRSGFHFLQLRLQGQFTQAVVFDRWEEPASDGNSYYVAYVFYAYPDQTGRKVVTNAQSGYRAYQKLRIGMQVKVRYLPNTPQVCQMADFSW
jgi:hypothetical protein